MQFVRPTYFLLVCCALVALLALPAASYPSLNGNYYRVAERTYDPDEVMDFLNRLSNAIRMERKLDNINGITSEKRGFDLGLNRGYSGNIQAAHLLGVAAAGYSGGPGRRRRDVSNN